MTVFDASRVGPQAGPRGHDQFGAPKRSLDAATTASHHLARCARVLDGTDFSVRESRLSYQQEACTPRTHLMI